jgi:hypothetical protein
MMDDQGEEQACLERQDKNTDSFQMQGRTVFFYSDKGRCESRFMSTPAAMATTPSFDCILRYGSHRQEQLNLIRTVEAHRDEIERAWNEHFS